MEDREGRSSANKPPSSLVMLEGLQTQTIFPRYKPHWIVARQTLHMFYSSARRICITRRSVAEAFAAPYFLARFALRRLPTIKKTDMPLPIHSEYKPPKSWEEFEDICADLYAQIWKDPGTQKHGRQGQPQGGVDIYGKRVGQGAALCGPRKG